MRHMSAIIIVSKEIDPKLLRVVEADISLSDDLLCVGGSSHCSSAQFYTSPCFHAWAFYILASSPIPVAMVERPPFDLF